METSLKQYKRMKAYHKIQIAFLPYGNPKEYTTSKKESKNKKKVLLF